VPETVRELWRYQTGDQVLCVSITSDGCHVIAGSRDKHIYFFDRAGTLLWRGELGGKAFRLALAEGRQCVLVGCPDGNDAYLWDYDGHLLQVFHTGGATWGGGVTSDADLVAIGSWDDCVYLFDQAGHQLWKRQVGGDINRLSITPDGQYIALGSDDHYVYLFDRAGNQRWRYQTGAIVWAGAQIAAVAGCIAAGSNDHHLYFLDASGRLVWKQDTGGDVNIVALTPDGRYVAAGSNADTISLFSSTGELLWRYQTGDDVYGLALSDDGRFLVAGSNDYHVYLYDRATDRVWKQQTANQVYGVAITPSGRLFAAASHDHHVYVFENNAAPEEVTSGADANWLAQAVIQRVRNDYVANPHLGVARWFDEFDQALRRGEFAVCRAMLKEVRDEGYLLSESEKAYPTWTVGRGRSCSARGLPVSAGDSLQKPVNSTRPAGISTTTCTIPMAKDRLSPPWTHWRWRNGKERPIHNCSNNWLPPRWCWATATCCWQSTSKIYH
jgi:hypothetical protein